jgi:glutamate/tyrosine decarboxylase-like PLP-dependent enzyme
MDARERAVRRASELAFEYLAGLDERHAGALTDDTGLVAQLGGPLPDEGEDPERVVEEMARAFDSGLVATAGPRYFGFVIGGQLPAAAGADLLTGVWAQNANLHALSPAAAAAELVAGPWMLDLLGLPGDASFGFPTGAAMGSMVGLAVGRHVVLGRAGWDVEGRGLYGAPEIKVIVGDEVHSTLLGGLQYLGLGRERLTRIPTDEQGRMRADALPSALDLNAPTIVAIQAGNVNTGAFDPADAVADALSDHPNAWIHVDGAFGLWAAASPELHHLVAGVERADSWATDAHKWLNVGYDCGFVAVRDAEAHRAAIASARAAYLMQDADHRDNWEYVLDSSRRARGFVVYAALRSLGRNGVREMVERCCQLARRMADRLRPVDGMEILNDVVLNQVLVRVTPPDGGDADAFTREVMLRVQEEGEAWMGGTTWHGLGAMRISVSNWSTTEADIDRTADAILRAAGR